MSKYHIVGNLVHWLNFIIEKRMPHCFAGEGSTFIRVTVNIMYLFLAVPCVDRGIPPGNFEFQYFGVIRKMYIFWGMKIL